MCTDRARSSLMRNTIGRNNRSGRKRPSVSLTLSFQQGPWLSLEFTASAEHTWKPSVGGLPGIPSSAPMSVSGLYIAGDNATEVPPLAQNHIRLRLLFDCKLLGKQKSPTKPNSPQNQHLSLCRRSNEPFQLLPCCLA